MFFSKSIFAGAIFLLLTAQTPIVKKEKPDERFKANNSFGAPVVKVLQGDLISVELDGELISIRLAEIDAPEERQPFSRQSRNFVEELVMKKQVTIVVKSVDRFKRVIGKVFLKDGKSLNREVVKWGYAWHYKVNLKEDKYLAALEYQAWGKKLGLWLDKNPIPPWKFRSSTEIPEPPYSPTKVDYDRIFEYGLVGDTRNRIYNFPNCTNYQIPPKNFLLIFSSKLGAESLGYRTGKSCPK
jgi:endonuclease YncB( thermonuclease family)